AWEGDLCIYENTEWQPRWFLVPNIIPVQTIDDGYSVAQAFDPESEAVVVGIEHVDIPADLLEMTRPSDRQHSIEVLKYGADEVRLNVSTDRDQYLVFSDTYFPGWRAWVDGSEVKIYRTDGIVKGIVVPQGEHEIRFCYDPVSYKIGWLLVFIGLILLPFLIRPITHLLGGKAET
ncbi:MAG: YfhO family protein, partial [bacterium]|nr:YfhO family protein [bacterium]